MPKLIWDKSGERFWETGVSKGVLFPMNDLGEYQDGVAWNGLTNVTQSPSGAEPSAIYADNIKYLSLMSVEELEASVEAYTYPDEWAQCDGSSELVDGSGVSLGQQPRKKFALSYQTKIGNDLNADLGYKIHIIYGCYAGPSEKSHDTVNDSPEAMTFSWDITTTPVDVVNFKPTASIVIDSTKVDQAVMAEIELVLYGDTSPAAILLPSDIFTIVDTGSYLEFLDFSILSAQSYQITHAPFPATLAIKDGETALVVTTDYTYDNTTGIISFVAEPTGTITITEGS